MSRPHDLRARTPSLHRLLAPLGAAALLWGCTSLEAKEHNLRALHDPDGKARFEAAVVGDLEYLFRIGLVGAVTRDGQIEKLPELRLRDPHEVSFRNLRELTEFSPSKRRAFDLQVEFCSWLAVDSEYVLTRERAVLMLGELALGLGVDEPLPAEEGVTPAGPEELAAALNGLIAASGPVLREGEEAPAAERAALAESCDAVRALDLDRAGARRAFAVASLLLYSAGRTNDDFAPVRELTEELARFSIARALWEAVDDPRPLVRIAAVEVWGELGDASRRQLFYRMFHENGGDVSYEVRSAVMRLYTEQGLPDLGPDATVADRAAWREEVVEEFIGATHALYGQEQVAACQALGAVADAGFESLRAEDWILWWESREQFGPELVAPGARP